MSVFLGIVVALMVMAVLTPVFYVKIRRQQKADAAVLAAAAEQHNKDMAQYDVDYAQYEQDLAAWNEKYNR